MNSETLKERNNEDCSIEFELPWPPSVNSYYDNRIVKGKRICRFISNRGKEFVQQVKDIVEPHRFFCRQRFFDRASLAVVVKVYPPDKRKRDLDNLGKALFDAMESAGVYEDDSQIDDLRYVCERNETVAGGKVHVTVSKID